MHRYQLTHGDFAVIPFGHRLLGAQTFTGAAHIARLGQLVLATINFPEQQFDTEPAARKYAETQAIAVIESGELKD
jgi:hypothetical protein